MFERTFESTQPYEDPFNEVEVDVIFEKGGQAWRVPMFWRGNGKWTVRFTPPSPGEYTYRLESTDRDNPDLNGQETTVEITLYSGASPALKHGMIRVSRDHRYFEYADGTPFYWLGDTWWMGFSDRLSWNDFKRLTADRKAKGFTVVQVVAGLVPLEELAPVDPGCGNEGGQVWDGDFNQINPRYFDYVDRRVQHLLEEGLTPAIVGAWTHVLKQMGSVKMKRHWRYLIARYGAYPVFWIAGGEVYDPPADIAAKAAGLHAQLIAPWSEVVQYIRTIDPYRHPLSVHDALELPALQDESLTDYHLFQCGHFCWKAIPNVLWRLHRPSAPVKPIVIGEIGYEQLGATNSENFQRAAFWLAMLNGAAGHTYGANGTFESYAADKPIHRIRWSFMSWEEGMNLPGSYQVGIAAQLLKRYPWWAMQPHPEWVMPCGHLFSDQKPQLHADEDSSSDAAPSFLPALGDSVIANGNFFLPYAAGIPSRLRILYMPFFDFMYAFSPPPTIVGLEPGVRYRAFFWDPVQGIKFDMGWVERPAPGKVLRQEDYGGASDIKWEHHRGAALERDGRLQVAAAMLSMICDVNETDVVVSVNASSAAQIGLVVRFQDEDNFLAALFSADHQEIYLLERKQGVDGKKLAKTSVGNLGPSIRLIVEVRGTMAAMSVADGSVTVTSPIVDLDRIPHGPVSFEPKGGRVGLIRANDGNTQSIADFEVRTSPQVVADERLETTLYDASGKFRGELRGGGIDMYESGIKIPPWEEFGRTKHFLLDAYRPDRLPYGQDWVLILEAVN